VQPNEWKLRPSRTPSGPTRTGSCSFHVSRILSCQAVDHQSSPRTALCGLMPSSCTLSGPGGHIGEPQGQRCTASQPPHRIAVAAIRRREYFAQQCARMCALSSGGASLLGRLHMKRRGAEVFECNRRLSRHSVAVLNKKSRLLQGPCVNDASRSCFNPEDCRASSRSRGKQQIWPHGRKTANIQWQVTCIITFMPSFCEDHWVIFQAADRSGLRALSTSVLLGFGCSLPHPVHQP
jgi:hypothetical protein